MPAATGPGKRNRDAPARHVYGPRSLGALVPGLVRMAFRQRSFAAAQVIADWQAIVGPASAAVTLPRRLAAGTLTIACAGPIALELQHLSPVLIERINAHLGRAVVQRLRLVQDPSQRLLAPPPAPRPDDRGAAERAVAGLSDGPLRDAWLALALALASRGP